MANTKKKAPPKKKSTRKPTSKIILPKPKKVTPKRIT